jgi:Tol biopolymer transport system component
MAAGYHRVALNSPSSPSQSSLSPGDRIGHCQIVELIGAGGMGEVYRAIDLRLQREVALKVLSAAKATDPVRRERFEREARAVAALSHPNIVTIYSVDEADGHLFLTMELVDGKPLSDLIYAGGLPLDRLLAIAMPLADAVSAAHARGITHRDLKPANVMVTEDQQVKVVDFGLAKWFDSGAGDVVATEVTEALTVDGAPVGTIAYMAPEQAEGKQVDARSDVFSLGVIFYEMATGERPFKGETSLARLAAILRDAPAPVTDINPAVPRPLARVIHRALAKDPGRRQQSGRDLWNDLDEVVSELSASALPKGLLPAAAKPAGWGPRWIAAGAVALVVAGVIGVVSFMGRQSSEPVAPEAVYAVVTPLTSETGVERSPSLSPDGKWLVYERILRPAPPDIMLRAVGGQTAINLTSDYAGADTQPTFSPDGEYIAFRSERDGGGLFVMKRTGEAVRRLTNDGFNPSWSPDGKSIVFAAERVDTAPDTRLSTSGLSVVSVPSGERRLLTAGDAVEPAWSPGGRRIAYWGLPNDGVQRDIWTIGVDGGAPVRVTNDAAIDWTPAWSPDGRYLYFSSNRSGGFSLWRVAIDEATGIVSGAPVALSIPRPGIGRINVAADGASIALVTSVFESQIGALAFNPAKGTVGARRVVASSSAEARLPAVSGDGRRIAFYQTASNGQEDLWIGNIDGTGLRQLTDDAAHDRGPRWSADGQTLLFMSDRSGTYQAWSIGVDGAHLRQITADPRVVAQPVWSPDGTRAISRGRDPVVLMFNPNVEVAHQQVQALPSHPEGFTPWAWSPDGSRVAGYLLSRPGFGIAIYTVATQSYETVARFGIQPAWLPDSRHLLYTNQNDIMLLDTDSKIARKVFSSPDEGLFGVAVSPDAREIFFGSSKAQVDIVLAKLSSSPQ